MSEPFLAEIRIFPFNFAPTGWAMCNGQIIPLVQNTSLFALLGTYYGGNGKSTFALPNLQGNAPMHPGQGPGLSLRDLGEMSGTEFVTLLQAEMPAHTHFMQATTAEATVADPNGALLAQGAWSAQGNGGVIAQYSTGTPQVQMAPTSLSVAGGGLPHNNMQPYLTLNFCIALQGIFPPRQ
jgi:microcystin-dependent protein